MMIASAEFASQLAYIIGGQFFVMTHFQPELAIDDDGEPFRVPAEAVRWRMRLVEGPGKPKLMRDPLGRPITVPIDATFEDLYEVVGPRKVLLDPVDEAGCRFKDVGPAVVRMQLAHADEDDESADAVDSEARSRSPRRNSAAPSSSRDPLVDTLLDRLVRVVDSNTRLAELVVTKIPSMLESASGLITAADGAKLPMRTPLIVPQVLEDDEDEDEDDKDDEPAEAVATKSGLPAYADAVIRETCRAVVDKVGDAFRDKIPLAALFDWSKAAPKPTADERPAPPPRSHPPARPEPEHWAPNVPSHGPAWSGVDADHVPPPQASYGRGAPESTASRGYAEASAAGEPEEQVATASIAETPLPAVTVVPVPPTASAPGASIPSAELVAPGPAVVATPVMPGLPTPSGPPPGVPRIPGAAVVLSPAIAAVPPAAPRPMIAQSERAHGATANTPAQSGAAGAAPAPGGATPRSMSIPPRTEPQPAALGPPSTANGIAHAAGPRRSDARAAPSGTAPPGTERTASDDSVAMTAHITAVYRSLSAKEQARISELAMALTEQERRAWLFELSKLSVPDAVARVRDLIRPQSRPPTGGQNGDPS